MGLVLAVAAALLLRGMVPGGSTARPGGAQLLKAQCAAAERGRLRRIALDLPLAPTDLEPLAALPSSAPLQAVLLPQAAADKAVAQWLARFTSVQELVLGNTTWDDADFSHLATLRRLRVLNLNATRASDAALPWLSRMHELEVLRLGSSRITGSGAVHLLELHHLRHLILQRAPIEDGALDAVARLPALESLYLEGTRVSDEAILRLKQRRPDLHVHW